MWENLIVSLEQFCNFFGQVLSLYYLSWSNLQVHETQAVKNICTQEKWILWLTCDPGLALTGFQTAWPRKLKDHWKCSFFFHFTVVSMPVHLSHVLCLWSGCHWANCRRRFRVLHCSLDYRKSCFLHQSCLCLPFRWDAKLENISSSCFVIWWTSGVNCCGDLKQELFVSLDWLSDWKISQSYFIWLLFMMDVALYRHYCNLIKPLIYISSLGKDPLLWKQ